MDIQVLVSVMNIESKVAFNDLIKKMNLIKSKCVFINQCPLFAKKDLLNYKNDLVDIYSYKEKGLSKSRNEALRKSNCQICLIADDDMTYVDGYEKVVSEAYDKYKDADIIAFYVENAKDIDNNKEGRLDFLHTLKLCSVQLSFKRSSIVDNDIKFDELFGSGSGKFNQGEENIFLADAFKKGLKVYYVPRKIAVLNQSESSWFNGYNKLFFESTGAKFYRISSIFYPVLILQFAIRKKKLYNGDVSILRAIKYMNSGVKTYKNMLKRVDSYEG